MKFIFDEGKGLPEMPSARVQRCAFLLSGFNYTIEYIKGKVNEADEISKISQYESKEELNENNFVLKKLQKKPDVIRFVLRSCKLLKKEKL